MARDRLPARRDLRDDVEYVPPEDVRSETAPAARRRPRPQGGTRPGGPGQTLTLLASVSGLRQAMLLQEILGTPVALRRPGSDARHQDF